MGLTQLWPGASLPPKQTMLSQTSCPLHPKMEYGPPGPLGFAFCKRHPSILTYTFSRDLTFILKPASWTGYSWLLSPGLSVSDKHRAQEPAAGPRPVHIQLMAFSETKSILSQSGAGTESRSQSKSETVPGTPIYPSPTPTQGKPDDEINIIVGDGDDHIWDIVGGIQVTLHRGSTQGGKTSR